MRRTLLSALLLIASCKTAEHAPPPAPPESTVEIVQMRNTPEGAIVTERVREIEPGEMGEPQEVVITAAQHPQEEWPMPLPPKGPPEVERGRRISVDWQGKGLAEGEVLDVRGNWVKLRFVVLEKGPEPNSTIGASVAAWVDFSKVGYYIPGPIEKRKVKRKAAAEEAPPKPKGEIH